MEIDNTKHPNSNIQIKPVRELEWLLDATARSGLPIIQVLKCWFSNEHINILISFLCFSHTFSSY